MAEVQVAVVGLGALGSATAAVLAGRGVDVVGLEQFGLGHDRGASHDTSRILRRSYHTPEYVARTAEAYADWAVLEQHSGTALVTTTGGVDLFPPGAAIPIDAYVASMRHEGVDFDVLTAADISARWPALRPPRGTTGRYQRQTAIVPAGLGTRVCQDLARGRGAALVDHTAVTALRPRAGAVDVVTTAGTWSAERVVVTADAWTETLLAPLGVRLGLTVTEEQLTYVEAPTGTAIGELPVWIWMDDPSYYGFPVYRPEGVRPWERGRATVKAAQDCGGPTVTGDVRSGRLDEDMLGRLTGFLAGLLPGCGAPAVSKRCLYTLTPDRDFVVGAVPGEPRIVVGLGAAHGFKFAPTFGRWLAGLALGAVPGPELHPFRLDRPALTEPAYAGRWLV